MAKPKYDTPMLAVYAGQTCIGHIYQRSKAGFEAFNTDDRSIGLFGSQREAADALSSGAHRMAEIAAWEPHSLQISGKVQANAEI
jgi:hypothetical protein